MMGEMSMRSNPLLPLSGPRCPEASSADNVEAAMSSMNASAPASRILG